LSALAPLGPRLSSEGSSVPASSPGKEYEAVFPMEFTGSTTPRTRRFSKKMKRKSWSDLPTVDDEDGDRVFSDLDDIVRGTEASLSAVQPIDENASLTSSADVAHEPSEFDDSGSVAVVEPRLSRASLMFLTPERAYTPIEQMTSQDLTTAPTSRPPSRAVSPRPFSPRPPQLPVLRPQSNKDIIFADDSGSDEDKESSSLLIVTETTDVPAGKIEGGEVRPFSATRRRRSTLGEGGRTSRMVRVQSPDDLADDRPSSALPPSTRTAETKQGIDGDMVEDFDVERKNEGSTTPPT